MRTISGTENGKSEGLLLILKHIEALRPGPNCSGCSINSEYLSDVGAMGSSLWETTGSMGDEAKWDIWETCFGIVFGATCLYCL